MAATLGRYTKGHLKIVANTYFIRQCETTTMHVRKRKVWRDIVRRLCHNLCR